MFCAFPRPRYQMSVYRTNGPLVLSLGGPFDFRRPFSPAREKKKINSLKTGLFLADKVKAFLLHLLIQCIWA